MERLYSKNECSLCKEIQNNCLSFPCKHFVCSKCYLDHYKPRIRELEKMIYQNIENFNGKSTCLGCVYRCEESLLTMDPSVLIKMYKENYDEELAFLVEKYRHFFLGIPSYFLKCEFCKNVHTDFRILEFCPIVKENYGAIFNETVINLISSYNMPNFQYVLSSFANVNPVLTEGYIESLVFLDQNQGIHFLNLKPFKIFKLSSANLKTHSFFALVYIKAIREENIFLFVDDVRDCVIKAIYKIEKTENATKTIHKQASNDTNSLGQVMKSLNLEFGFTFIKNSNQVYVNDQLVESLGSQFILMISPNFDVYSEKCENERIKIYTYCREYAKVGSLVTLAKAITFEQSENFIIVSGFDMISYTKIYRLT